MKKLQSTWYNMLIVLTLIAVVAGAALGYVNSLTEQPIKEIKQQKLSEGIKAVLGGQELTVQSTDTLESGAIVYTTTAGKAVEVTGNGFGGTLKVLVGFNQEGDVLGYRILETQETPGLGAKADEWFQQPEQKPGSSILGLNPGKEELTVSKDGGKIDAITASTITSRAFLRCVNAAYKALGGTEDKDCDGETGASEQHHKDKKHCEGEAETSEQHHNDEKHCDGETGASEQHHKKEKED